MEKRKNNKKLFAIIAGSALAFVLTIALSVSITLAYFGETKTETGTVTMGTAVTLGTPTTSMANVTAIPTQTVNAKATAVCTATNTDSVLWAVVSVTDSNSLNTTTNASVDSAWTKYGTTESGTVYFLGNDSAITQLGTGTTDVSKELTYTFVVDSSLTNNVAGKTLTVSVTFIRVQVVYNSSNTIETTADKYEAAVESVGNISITPSSTTA